VSETRTTVVKIGGSLLSSPHLPQRLRAWLATQSTSHPETHFVLIVGGGRWVDNVRELDGHSDIGQERAHWICIELMDVTAGLLSAMLPELSTVSALAEITKRVALPGVTIVKPREFLEHAEPHAAGTKLPEDWSVSSDSIAARLAIVLGADELVLLKSAPTPATKVASEFLAEWAAAGYVDTFLPVLQHELPSTVAGQLM
jgi:aspartokinase-like uncharacterized kinase